MKIIEKERFESAHWHSGEPESLHLTIRNNKTGETLRDEDVTFIMGSVILPGNPCEASAFVHGGDRSVRIVGALITCDQAKEVVLDKSDVVQLGYMRHCLGKIFPSGIKEDDDE